MFQITINKLRWFEYVKRRNPKYMKSKVLYLTKEKKKRGRPLLCRRTIDKVMI